MSILNLLAGLVKVFPKTDTSRKFAFLNEAFEFLIHEKYASQKASLAFGITRSNSDIAQAYAKEVAKRIEQSGTQEIDNCLFWENLVNRLSVALNSLYDKIDDAMAGRP